MSHQLVRELQNAPACDGGADLDLGRSCNRQVVTRHESWKSGWGKHASF